MYIIQYNKYFIIYSFLEISSAVLDQMHNQVDYIWYRGGTILEADWLKLFYIVVM